MSDLEEIAELLRLRDELKREISLMEMKYREALRDQEILKNTLEKLKEENRRLRRERNGLFKESRGVSGQWW